LSSVRPYIKPNWESRLYGTDSIKRFFSKVDEDEDFASQIESCEYIIPRNEELYLLVKYYKPRK
jgi:hypothetical protein